MTLIKNKRDNWDDDDDNNAKKKKKISKMGQASHADQDELLVKIPNEKRETGSILGKSF